MKLKTFIKRLQKIEEKHGNIDIVVHTDNREDKHAEPPSTITWFTPTKKGKKATQVMICDSWVVRELG